MALWSRIAGLIGGGAVAGAAAAAVEPVLEGLRQDAWKANSVRVLQVDALAQAIAQELLSEGAAADEASREGFSGDKLAYLIRLAQTAPDMATALRLLQREFIGEGDFDHARKKAALEPEWTDKLSKLKDNILSVADVANAVQQGFMPNEGILPGVVGGETNIDIPVDEVGLSPHTEAKHSGFDADRLKILTELVGLPPGPGELMMMLNRGIITDKSFYVGLREGHTKTKWSNALKALRHAVITPIEATNLQLRGWIGVDKRNQLGALSGMSPDNMELLYLMQGRPPGPGQLQTAFNRGLIDRARFDKGIKESDVRPEWTDVYFGLRRRYPTVFVLRQLVTSGALTSKEGEDILILEGFPPDLAAKIAKAWSAGKVGKQKELAMGSIETLYEARYIDGGQATALLEKLGYTGDEITLILELGDARRVKRFLDAAIGRIHTKYVSHLLPEQTALLELQALNLSAQAVSDIMAEWKLEREVNVPALTPAQIVAAHHWGLLSRDEAIAELKSRGYSDRDAKILVDIREHGPPPGQPL